MLACSTVTPEKSDYDQTTKGVSYALMPSLFFPTPRLSGLSAGLMGVVSLEMSNVCGTRTHVEKKEGSKLTKHSPCLVFSKTRVAIPALPYLEKESMSTVIFRN